MTKNMTVRDVAEEANRRLDARYARRSYEDHDIARARAIEREIDRRSETSRANLENHIPPRIDTEGDSVVITVRVTKATRARLELEADKHGNTLSQHIRHLINDSHEG